MRPSLQNRIGCGRDRAYSWYRRPSSDDRRTTRREGDVPAAIQSATGAMAGSDINAGSLRHPRTRWPSSAAPRVLTRWSALVRASPSSHDSSSWNRMPATTGM